MRMAELVNKANRAGHWHSADHNGRRTVFHHNHAMLWFHLNEDKKWDGDVDSIDFSTGWGSVSDQHGMNRLFAEAGMPFVFLRDSRGGGARIETIEVNDHGQARHHSRRNKANAS